MKKLQISRLLAALWLVGCASSETIRSPHYRLGIPGALSLQDMRLAVQNGILAAGWNVNGERGASILAGVSTSDSWAKVVIDYRPDAYRIRHHQTSPTMNYDRGHISWRYNKWVLRLDNYLRQAVARMVSVKNTARVTEPPPSHPQERFSQGPPPSPLPEQSSPPQTLTSEETSAAAPMKAEESSLSSESVNDEAENRTEE